MFAEIQITSTIKQNLKLDDKCSICLQITSPKVVHSLYNDISDRTRVSILRHCEQCNHYAVNEFDVFETSMGAGYREIDRIEPLKVEVELPTPEIITKNIKQLSPIGCKTYVQALNAELHGHDMLVGIGLRKALEFFLKDFLILTNPDKKEDIQEKLLGKVITDYIQEPTLLSLARATTWLGNDETHYVRKHTDKDLQDLKKFLSATLRYIEYQLTILDAQELVNRSKKS